MLPTLSIVIPRYNEEKYLGLLLDNLANQSLKPAQVIIGDSSSIDNTIAVAKGFSDRLPIEVAVTPLRTPGGARNAAQSLPLVITSYS